MGRGPAREVAVAQVFVDDVDTPVVRDEDVHHLVHALRARPGEAVMVADGRGHWRRCRIAPGPQQETTAESGRRLLEAAGPVEFDERPASPVTVGFVPVKGERPEWVVQKLTEIGVDRITVLHSARSVVRWDGERRDKALARLRRVAREAAAQSRRAWLPTVDGVMSVAELSDRLAPVPLGLADPDGPPPDGSVLALAVGPEGGWGPGELDLPGTPRVGLGPAILRAETATVVAATVLCALRDGSLRPW